MKLHCAVGCAGEAGELSDVIKREVIYELTATKEGKSIKEGIVEECGDLFFYLVATLNQYDIDFEDIIQHNYGKLSARYKKLVYSDKAAGDRADKVEAVIPQLKIIDLPVNTVYDVDTDSYINASIPFTGNGANK